MTDSDEQQHGEGTQRPTESGVAPAAMQDEADEQDYYPKGLTGKVVGFLNQRELIMDVGSVDGVRVGMQFVILVPGGAPVFGDDGREIGRLEVPKTIVKVVRVDGDHVSVGRTFMTIKGRPARDFRQIMAPNFASLDRGFYQEATPDRIETFNVTRSETVRAESDLSIHKGDDVRLTQGDEFIFPG